MIIEYKNMQAYVSYSSITKCYYGAIEHVDDYLIAVQASSKDELIESLHFAVDQYLQLGPFFLNFS